MRKVHIGTSGFLYRHWRGNFYPEKLPQKRWLRHYSERFSTVELNVTFYRLPEKKTFTRWYEESPPGFTFSIKGSRFITHVKRLLSPREPLDRFMDGASGLKDKLGVILWQFPPNFGKHTERLGDFLKALRPHDARNAFEFREESWLDEEVITLIRQEGQCLCTADWPPFIDSLPLTSDFVYIRRHGRGGRYGSCYSKGQLRSDGERIMRYPNNVRDVFIYFNNDARGYAPRNALELKDILGH
jgi:uncharacterized protein YecE (DUF72 family)